MPFKELAVCAESHVLWAISKGTHINWRKNNAQWFIQQMASTYNMLVCWKTLKHIIYVHIRYMFHVYVTTCNDLYGRLCWSQGPDCGDGQPSYYFFSVSSRENLFSHIILLSFFPPTCWHWPNLTTIMVFPIPMNMPNSPYQANPINGIFMRAMNTPIQTSHQCLIGNQWYSLKFARARWSARISQHKPTGLKNEEHINASDSGTWVPEREQQCNM